MTRRRFRHCQNEKCNRRLGELPKRLEESDPPATPAPAWCEGCRAMLERGPGPEYYATGWDAGVRRGFLYGLAASVVVGLALWAIGHLAAWIQAAPA